MCEGVLCVMCAGVLVGFQSTLYSNDEIGGQKVEVSIVREDSLSSDHGFTVRLVLSTSASSAAGQNRYVTKMCIYNKVCM